MPFCGARRALHIVYRWHPPPYGSGRTPSPYISTRCGSESRSRVNATFAPRKDAKKQFAGRKVCHFSPPRPRASRKASAVPRGRKTQFSGHRKGGQGTVVPCGASLPPFLSLLKERGPAEQRTSPRLRRDHRKRQRGGDNPSAADAVPLPPEGEGKGGVFETCFPSASIDSAEARFPSASAQR